MRLRPRVFVLVTAATVGTLLLTMGNNCAKYQAKSVGTADSAISDGDSQCGVVQSLALDPSKDPFHDRKIHLFPANVPGGAGTLSAKIVSGQKKIEFIVDQECVASTGGGTLTAQFAGKGRGLVYDYETTLGHDLSLSDLQARAEEDPCLIGLVEPVEFKTISALNDPKYAQMKHFPPIREEQARSQFFENPVEAITSDVVIAIIDTGVDIGHDDLKTQLWENPLETAANNVDDDGNGIIDDVNGANFATSDPALKGNPSPIKWTGADEFGEVHGTHVAGLAAGKAGNSYGGSGIMGSHARIMSLNVFGAVPGATQTAIANAIRYAADHGADVINMSLGGPVAAPSVDSALTYAESKGVTIVVAAGNNGQELSVLESDGAGCRFDGTGANLKCFISPASYGPKHPGMIVVGSIDVATLEKSNFSNYNPEIVDIGAPGHDTGAQNAGLLSALPRYVNPPNPYGFLAGTSMASPVVAGSVALTRGYAKTHRFQVTLANFKKLLKDGSQARANLQSSFSGGRSLDLEVLFEAVSTLRSETPPCP